MEIGQRWDGTFNDELYYTKDETNGIHFTRLHCKSQPELFLKVQINTIIALPLYINIYIC